MKRLFSIALLVALAAFSSCRSDGDGDEPSLPSAPIEDFVPVESFGVEYLFSDSARVTALLKSEHIIERMEGDKNKRVSVHYLDQGVLIRFFDLYGNVTSEIRSNEAVYRSEKSLAELKGNVILTSSKGERMETEQLFWDGKKDSIYTDQYVRIQTPDKIISGTRGLIANSSFTSYRIFGIRGELDVNEDEGF